MIDAMAFVGAVCFIAGLLPIVVMVCVRCGTYAFYKSKAEFEEMKDGKARTRETKESNGISRQTVG